MTTPIFRFAPSPNGYLHLGHALSAILNFDMAPRADGRFLLRIEDIDATRCRPEYEAAIYEYLAWLGLAWEHPGQRQSDHLVCDPAALGGTPGFGDPPEMAGAWARSRREIRNDRRGSRGLGRCHSRPQGHCGQLSCGCRDCRRAPGHHRGGARPGPVGGPRPAPPVAASP